ncbi:MAG: glutathione S-transferase C-terminal domain-containing protein, partial [Hyphomicrobiales bacterium]
SISVVDHLMRDKGWEFSDNEGAILDPLFGAKTMADIYVKADPKFTGRVTVPVLWDKETSTIVSNESSEIIRMINDGFRDLSALNHDFYPASMRGEIDAVNEKIYHAINNGVYKSGFATTQRAYDEAVTTLFEALDFVENLLVKQSYVAGDVLTEADWRLFTTLVRFDPVYVGHFKCNLKRIEDYPNLSNYLRALYQVNGVAETVNMDHIKRHYYESHATVNPTAIVPKGPEMDLLSPHNRPVITLV